MSKFFIDRPVFAWVIAIVIMMAGALAILRLPVEQYPKIAPPTVSITASYPGASAKTLEDTVTQVIEQKMTGLDHFRYMSSNSDSSGNVTITLTFEPEANPDIAQVQVQNKLQLATPLLPQEVQQRGIQVSKAGNDFLLVVGFVSSDGRLSQGDIADYVTSNLQDTLSRVEGVGDITVFGPQHAMRIWLDPDALNNFALTTTDVSNAIKTQNAQVSAGQLGGAPAVQGQQINATITAQSRLQTPEQFGAILLRVNPDGSQVRLRDVARIEIGSETYEINAAYNGKPAAGVGIKLATGANALNTAAAVKARVAELQPFFPAGIEVIYPYDTTPFVQLSIHEVIKTLFEAIVLVFVVMYLFLQNFRATLIPTIAVPVVLLGTFGVLSAFGFSINVLTMFGMVLAIGLLVDDAIVVVENVERVMSEEGLSPREATRKSMDQITGALVGIALVLSAVFVPMAFFGGSAGAIYRQFSLTIVSAMALSVLVALVLTPALCATILKPVTAGHGHARGGFFGLFNRGFDAGSRVYVRGVRGAVNRLGRYFIAYLLILGGLGYLFLQMPSSFLPTEDRGQLFVLWSAPPNASSQRTAETAKAVTAYFLEQEKDSVEGLFTIVGFNFSGRGQNAGMAFVRLKDWSERTLPSQKPQAIAGRVMGAMSKLKDAVVFSFLPPSVPGLGNATGFDLQLVDRGGLGHDRLMQARNQLLGMAAQNPKLVGVRPNGLEDTPQFKLDIDREKASALGLSLSDINTTLSAAWGSSYVNDFIDQGRVKKVYLQADAPYRMQPSDIDRWYVRNASGQMVPFSAFTTAQWIYGSPKLERYNGSSSLNIQGSAAPGISSGEAMAEMEAMMQKLPQGIGYEWTGLSYEERLSGSQAPALYALSMIIVFLCLAALYESWSVPVSVIMVVPLGVIGAVVAATLRGLPSDVYFQVGLLTTIGLSAKNAILIVEFAKALYDQGMELKEAAAEACRQRLRPIIMTSMAFILGVLPLAISTGAGSESQNAIGVGVMGGMISATVLAVLFVPVFFVAVYRLFVRRRPGHGAMPQPAAGD
ncbi:efflux RND transporter permease subunit (plasmid) [Azospirillum oryzae]|uniref:Efflux pump membrane transporter n=1 Tax=Azospirillum oryzae TaxID=286727 RepID=A0A6N1ANR0_9PROT|nr:efflux RND transporter permease subunit [Azospirillum oryzae]KAA0585099.1 efflux RND transporter permease subunit [Azospirillum oryzae]QKS53465.1 efflux RND transporter permease subunit [Azospirillum oryzae]GLR80890.1 multidrug efflux RND transporter permease subunit [Azospirillum oryzae]